MFLSVDRLLFARQSDAPSSSLHGETSTPDLHLRLLGIILALLLSGFAMSSMGCGSGAATKAGSIAVTYPAGASAGNLPVYGVASVSMTPLNDLRNLGVDWSLSCGGSPASAPAIGTTTVGCGTLVPAHTPSGVASTYTAPALVPVGNTVTILARVTSDPSQSSSVTVTIGSLPISIAFQATPPASLEVGQTSVLGAVLGNDVTGAGANWTVTCGSSNCGTFNPSNTVGNVTTTYTAPTTAPAGGTVTITAASAAQSSVSVSATIAILPITVTVSPSSFSIPVSGTESLKATVANDLNKSGVNWSCAPVGSCGKLSATKTNSGVATTFTAPATVPSGGIVTITATSVSDGMTTGISTATITTAPVISVAITQAPAATLAEGVTASLRATVNGDSSNAGVDWTASCGSSLPMACGSFSPTSTGSGVVTVYTAPLSVPPGTVTIIATSHAYDLNPALFANPATANVTITAPASIAFTQQPPASLTTNATAPVSAFVTNDAATGGGVTWTVQCSSTAAGACGYVRPYKTANGATATYVAPPVSPGVTIKVKATSTAFSGTSILSTTAITVVPSTTRTISLVPFAPSQLQVGTTVNLNAAVTNDASNAGVDWAVCGSGCGFFTIKPAIPEIPAVPPSQGDPGSPYVPPVPAVTATSVQAWPNGLPISYTAPPLIPAGGSLVVSAISTADRLNNVTFPATAVSTIAITTEGTGPSLQGVVQAGYQPVVGSSVYLYAAGTSGYASASTPMYSPTGSTFASTNSSGVFTIPAGYTCPAPTSEIYLVAVGGLVANSETSPSSTANPNLALMTALGPCSNLSSTPVTINEVTTVVSASALAPFSGNYVEAGVNSYLNIGSSGANASIGLANAFASVNNLVNVTTGQPLFNTLAGNATVPSIEINTFADALNACAVTAGGSAGDGTACGNLFTDANPLAGLYAAGAPTDTLQAAFNIVKAPGPTISFSTSFSGLFGLTGPASPFQPILSSAPNDFSIALNYTSGGGVGGSGVTASGSSAFALDGAGNLWISNKKINSVSEWNNFGAAISPSTSGTTTGGFASGTLYAPGPLAVDPGGNVWVVNGDGTLTEFNSMGAVIGGPFVGGGLATGAGIAIDGLNNIWITNSGSPGSVTKFNSRGIAQSPVSGYFASTNNPLPIAIDGSNNVWVQNESGNGSGEVELNDTSGSVAFTYGSRGDGQPQIAADASGNIWWTEGGCEVTGVASAYANGGIGRPQVSIFESPTLSQNPQGVAIDGANRVWIGNAGETAGCNNTVPPNVTLIDAITNGWDFSAASLANGPVSMAIDSSGNIWVLLANNTITEFVGVATPAVTPLAQAVKSAKVGSKP